MQFEPLPFHYSDGGRSRYFRGNAGDCVIRSICNATGLDYMVVYRAIGDGCRAERKAKHSLHPRRSGRNGVDTSRQWFKDYMRSLGFVWVSPGFGGYWRLCVGSLPATGVLVLNMCRHYSCLYDGVILDDRDPSRFGTARVFGYWYKDSKL